MNLTTKQKEIYEKIQSVDSDWDEQSFATAWNNILKLNKKIKAFKLDKEQKNFYLCFIDLKGAYD